MSQIPEGVQTVHGESRDLKGAIDAVAEQLGVAPHQVSHKLDLAHFRSQSGGSVARRTVKIIGWVNPDAPADEAEAAPVSTREDSTRDREEVADQQVEEMEEDAPSTEASEFAQAWFVELLRLMSVEAKVQSRGEEGRVLLRVTAERAGRIIGKRGATLAAIRHVLALALEQYGDPVIDVDVTDNRPRRSDPKRSDNGPGGRSDKRRGRRSDRSDRRDRDRDRDRGDRDRNRRPRGRNRGASGQHDPEKLEALAQRAAQRAIETGRTITINLDLNSYDRRLVHLAISEIEGVNSESQEKDDKKYVQVMPE